MPELSRWARRSFEFADQFLVVGVHAHGPTVAEARRALAEKKSLGGDLSPDPLPDLAADRERGVALRFDPEFLGDMFLLAPDGTVAATGKDAIHVLQARVKAVEGRIDALRGALTGDPTGEDGKDAEALARAAVALASSGVESGERAADEFALACPTPALVAVLEAMARMQRFDGVVAALADKDAKRRRAALAVAERRPSTQLLPALLELSKRKGDAKESLAALRAACASGPDDSAVEQRVLDVSVRGDVPTRAECVDLLAALASSGARERLLVLLAKDNAVRVRSAAATALGRLGGDDAVAALRRAASEDAAAPVRAAAKAALDAAPGPPGTGPVGK